MKINVRFSINVMRKCNNLTPLRSDILVRLSPPVCLQVETWPAPPYLATRLMCPPQDKAATPPPRSLEWFPVGDTTPFFYDAINFTFTGLYFSLDSPLQFIFFEGGALNKWRGFSEYMCYTLNI